MRLDCAVGKRLLKFFDLLCADLLVAEVKCFKAGQFRQRGRIADLRAVEADGSAKPQASVNSEHGARNTSKDIRVPFVCIEVVDAVDVDPVVEVPVVELEFSFQADGVRAASSVEVIVIAVDSSVEVVVAGAAV